MDTIFNQRFDERRKFQYVNDEPSVLHCHHYTTLFTKLAINLTDIEGPKLLVESMEESFYLVLKKYFVRYNVASKADRIKVAEDYYGLVGMGKLKLIVNDTNGTAEMKYSHVDEGWIKKWGKADFVVNYAGQGYILAVFDLINNKEIRTYDITETNSIVKGDSISKFEIKLK